MILTATLALCISPSILARFEDRVKPMWNAHQPIKSAQLRDQWKRHVKGWRGDYQHAEGHRPEHHKEGRIRRYIPQVLLANGGTGSEAASEPSATSDCRKAASKRQPAAGARGR